VARTKGRYIGRDYQPGFAGLVHTAEPTGVLFIAGILLPNLHRLAAARTRIAVVGNDDVLPSAALSSTAWLR
jgi:hypothetical protein